MDTARDITTSAMLGPCQLPQGWEERGCQTAKISGQGWGQAGLSTQMQRGGGDRDRSRQEIWLQLGDDDWEAGAKPTPPGLKYAGVEDGVCGGEDRQGML
jgi:hypothetical protein